jgi:predicted PurR-regulated permease PerM
MRKEIPGAYMQRLWLVILALALALAAWAIRDAILLVFAAALIAVAVHGVADLLIRGVNLPRPAALGVAGLLLTGSFAGVLIVFGTQINAELSGVAKQLPGAWERAREILSAHPAGAAIVSEASRMGEEGAGPLKDMLARAGGAALPFASALTSAVLVLFTAGFLTVAASAMYRGSLMLFPDGLDIRVGEALTASARALRKWLLGITFDMILISLLMGIALWALGVPAFIGLALIAGLSQFVPTVGPLISAIPGILLAFTVGPATAAWTALAYLLVSQLEANLIYPLVQKKTASIPPALNLFAILASGMLLGPLGVLLATPLLVVVMVFVVQFYVRDTLGKEAPLPGH